MSNTNEGMEGFPLENDGVVSADYVERRAKVTSNLRYEYSSSGPMEIFLEAKK